MSLRILEMAHSPFCIPIVRILEACDVPFEREEVPNWDRRRVAEVTNGHYYQVPVLIDGDAVISETAADSQDVARYVDARYAGGRLFPDWADGLQDIVIEYLENEVEDVTFKCVDPRYCDELDPVDRALVVRHKERKFGPGCVESWRRDHEALVAEAGRHFRRFDAMLAQRPFVLGNEPVFADFLLFGIAGNFTWKGWNELPESCENLIAWNQRVADLEL